MANATNGFRTAGIFRFSFMTSPGPIDWLMKMADPDGLEPPMAGIKTRCLTNLAKGLEWW